MDPALQSRGVENPGIVDLIHPDSDAGDVVLVMIERRPWGSHPQQHLQLNDKLNSYFTYVLDGHFALQYPRYANLPVRFRLDCVEPPGEVEEGMLRLATRLAQEQGLSFEVRVLDDSAIEVAPWERDDAAPAEATQQAAGPPYNYRDDVLAVLESFGVRPRKHTDPALVRELINDLYRLELREQKARRKEVESVFGPQPLESYAERVRALRERYSLLSLPVEQWTES